MKPYLRLEPTFSSLCFQVTVVVLRSYLGDCACPVRCAASSDKRFHSRSKPAVYRWTSLSTNFAQF
jgi:hypothetical protein